MDSSVNNGLPTAITQFDALRDSVGCSYAPQLNNGPDNNTNKDFKTVWEPLIPVSKCCLHVGLFPEELSFNNEEQCGLYGNNEGDLLWEYLESSDFFLETGEEQDFFFNNEASRLNNEVDYSRMENNENYVFGEDVRPRLSVDLFIDVTVKNCWEKLENHVHNQKRMLLVPDEYDASDRNISWNPHFKDTFAKNSGLFHAVIKHGWSLNYLSFDGDADWLKGLNKDCEKLKIEKDEYQMDVLEQRIAYAIENYFETIIKLAKQLGNHLKNSLENPQCPVFVSFNENGLLVFYKNRGETRKDDRYFLFVLADGKRNHEKTTLITVYKLRPRDFKSKIKRNNVTPDCWIEYKTGVIHKNRMVNPTETLNENHVYICFDEETICNAIFVEMFKNVPWNRNSTESFKEFLEARLAEQDEIDKENIPAESSKMKTGRRMIQVK